MASNGNGTVEQPQKRVRLATDTKAKGHPILTDDVNIKFIGPLLPPALLLEELPISETLEIDIARRRKEVADIIEGVDDRLLIVVGPCSVHDVKAAKEYAIKLRNAVTEFEKDLLIIMRVYFEKPRTSVGWKGLINDPDLDGSYQINKGLRMGRGLLLAINELGLGCAVEFLDTISPQFIADLVSWGAIGARTTESQVHRELASGLSMPLGFKNGTSGDTQIAVDAMKAAAHGHTFLSVTKQGVSAIVHTAGNAHTHLILRGGKGKTNFDAGSVEAAKSNIEKANIRASVMIDCSHDNSRKNFENQPKVASDIAAQVAAGNSVIRGLMIESHLKEGKQSLNPGTTFPKDLRYGVSVTDGCISFDDTLPILRELASAVQNRRKHISLRAL